MLLGSNDYALYEGTPIAEKSRRGALLEGGGWRVDDRSHDKVGRTRSETSLLVEI